MDETGLVHRLAYRAVLLSVVALALGLAIVGGFLRMTNANVVEGFMLHNTLASRYELEGGELEGSGWW